MSEGAAKVISALEQRPQLYYAVARLIRPQRIFGPWHKTEADSWERHPAAGKDTIQVKFVKAMFQIPTPQNPHPPGWVWRAYSQTVGMPMADGSSENFNTLDEAMAWADEAHRDAGCILVPGVIDAA